MYAYTGASQPNGNQVGNVARLISPSYDAVSPPTEGCIKFFYRLYGPQSNVGTLQTYVRANQSQAILTPLWAMSLSKGDEWHEARVAVPAAQMGVAMEVSFSRFNHSAPSKVSLD